MTTETRTAFREDRQFGESYADNEQVYRTIGITNAQLQRLPMWARLAIARADATIIRRDNTITELLAALVAANDWLELAGPQCAPGLAEYIAHRLAFRGASCSIGPYHAQLWISS